MSDARLACTLDQTVGDRVRVRSWRHASSRTLVGDGAHAEVEVAWVLSGSVRYGVGRRTLEVGEGEAVILPPEVEHRTFIEPGTRAGSLWIDRAVADGVGAALGRRALEPSAIGAAPRVGRIGALLQEEAAQEGPGRILAVESLVEAMLVAMLRGLPQGSAGAPRDPRIAAAVDRIHAELCAPLSVADLADTAAMSRYHFSRLFREQVGLSPYRYLRRVRVDRAAELLRAGRSVTAAAYDVAFRDLGRFARAFRERHGVSPSEFARNARRIARTA